MSERMYRRATTAALAVVTLVVLLTFGDFGIIWDEEWQNVYGEKLLAFYLSGFQDRSAFEYRDLYLYGGAFDLVAAVVTNFSPLGEYETRHLLGGMVGVVGMIGAARLARLLAGERAAFLTVVLLALTPALYGHMFNNPKDAPFAWGMIWASYFACRLLQEAPRPAIGSVIGFGVALGLSLATRVVGVLALFYLATATMLLYALAIREGRSWRSVAEDGAAFGLRLLPAIAIAYALMAFGWPWSAAEPLNPLRALLYFRGVPWTGTVLIDGQVYPGGALPAFYWPLFLAIKLPELVIAGLIAALAVAAASLRNGVRIAAVPLACYAVPVLSALFPVLCAMALKPLDFNGIRHFLFTAPPFVVLSAIGLDMALRKLAAYRPAFARGFAALVIAAGAWQAWIMVSLHPNQYVYFNQLVGGTGGAAGRYELDYWGNSLAEASRGLVAHLEQERGGAPVHTKHSFLICGYPLSALYYLPKGFSFTYEPSEAEFVISLAESYCPHKLDGQSIVEVRREGALLSYVKDRRHLLGTARVQKTKK